MPPTETPHSNGKKLPTIREIADLRAKYEASDTTLRAAFDAAYSALTAAGEATDQDQLDAALIAAADALKSVVTPVQSMRFAALEMSVAAHVVAEHIGVLEAKITRLEAAYAAAMEQAEGSFQDGLNHAALSALGMGEAQRTILLNRLEEADGDYEDVRRELVGGIEMALRSARDEYDYWKAYMKGPAMGEAEDELMQEEESDSAWFPFQAAS